MNQEKNECIQCSIHNCVHHAGTADYCTLDRICLLYTSDAADE